MTEKKTTKCSDNLKSLSAMELTFMQFIWEFPEGVSSEQIYEHFPQARGTKSTILYNIASKGYVQNHQEGRHHIYKALISRETYEKMMLQKQLEKTLGNHSFERLVAAFCGKERLSEKQADKARKFLQEIMDEMGDQ